MYVGPASRTRRRLNAIFKTLEVYLLEGIPG